MSQSHGLGKGLSSLIPQKGNAVPASASSVRFGFEPVGSSASAPKSTSPFSAVARQPKIDQSQSSVKPNTPPSPRLVPASPAAAIPAKEEVQKVSGTEGMILVPIGDIVPNPHQPRIQFSEDKLLELSQSIREHGILQPLIVTRIGDKYELIAGERRLQAAKMAGLPEVPVVIRKADDQEKFEYAIIENIQRHDLNPIEEARAYDRLSKEFNLSQEDISKKMGRSRSAIANTMRLLHLPVEIQRAVATGKISEGHAKALLAIDQQEKQRALFELIIRDDLNVRETEIRSREISSKPPKRIISKDPNIEARERTLSEIFGTKVRIAKTGSGGSIRIEYFSDEEFGSIFSRLAGNDDFTSHDPTPPKADL